ncbi:MAG: cystathionine gamma-synthase [Candidatus Kapaibacteriales bacterium]
MSKDYSSKGFQTRALHAGNAPDETTGAVAPALYQTSTYVQSSPGKHKGYEYSRTHNPTRDRLQECLATLEKAQHSIVTSTGMSATQLIMQSVPKGSKVLCGDDVYGGTYRLFNTVINDDFDFTFADSSVTDGFITLIEKHRPYLIWLETPTNPLLKVCDIKAISDAAKKVGSKVVVDNTFASPYFQNPLELGADIAYHSMSKYMNGHSDVVAGAMMLNDDEWHERLFKLQNSTGPTLSPFDSWLVLRGVKTLGIRMQRHQENAMRIAEHLENHPQVERVVYPGLKSHPQHEIAKKQMSGFSGMITFFIKGGLEASRKFLENVDLFVLAESLGGVESLIEHPAIMTHASIPKEEREKIGLSDNLVRISVGIEEVEDLIEDLENGFAAAK